MASSSTRFNVNLITLRLIFAWEVLWQQIINIIIFNVIINIIIFNVIIIITIIINIIIME